MKKIMYIIIVLFLLVGSNTLIAILAANKAKSEMSTSLSDCFINSNIGKQIQVRAENADNGTILTIFNNTDCITLEYVVVDFLYEIQNKKDSISLDVNESIKPNIEAEIFLRNILSDSTINTKIKVKEISF